MIDPEYSLLDAIKRDNVTLVRTGIERIIENGVLDKDGVEHEVDVIVYATGFRANQYLFPMTITGQDGRTIEELWAEDGPRAYRGCMMPGFPNFWSIYGPNTNGALMVGGFHEMVVNFALSCMERLIRDGEKSLTVTEDAYWAYNRMIDEKNLTCVWSDRRVGSYYWTAYGRSVVMNPLTGPEMWSLLKQVDFHDFKIDRG